MTIENHVTSLEFSTRLKELGVKQESLFSWFETGSYGNLVKITTLMFDLCEYNSVKRICSAFLSSELSEMLPYELNCQSLILTKCWSCWEIKYQEGDYPREKSLARFVHVKQADVCALMLIHLIENKIWEPE